MPAIHLRRGARAAVLAAAFAGASPCMQGARATGKFDGTWSVTLTCQTGPDGAYSYTFHFPATVVDGVLHGERGNKGRGGWFTLDGKIEPDGGSTLIGQGLTSAPGYTVGHMDPLTPYEYNVSAHFDAASGTGSRTTTRQCDFVFVKQ
ncbi:hypothetical protein F4827_005573 [Paraburkholderia bannensis]|uniref:Uncharacterized protein n=1 Tax=Paraburkholderia bannensis TaxID=765414 RepID=A0A7W9WW98_9BURK|nr:MULTISPECIES: hypothetical protein [Paraburkholderia]MBB3260798.1 hypothetical protein [Paraburkholderia sp. WP4_3_2]MBB6105703.1 hypothetical protein [Paraburkholderia bannensis]